MSTSLRSVAPAQPASVHTSVCGIDDHAPRVVTPKNASGSSLRRTSTQAAPNHSSVSGKVRIDDVRPAGSTFAAIGSAKV